MRRICTRCSRVRENFIGGFQLYMKEKLTILDVGGIKICVGEALLAVHENFV